MTRILEGRLSVSPHTRIAIAVSRFNATITEPLLTGARRVLAQHGVADLDIAWCPGAFELPLLASRMAQSGRYAAVIALGAVIRGETYHFEVISNAAVDGLQQVALTAGIPVALGVLTADTLEQAKARSAPDNANKGAEAAMAALEMVSLLENDVG
ncbi:MAG: 6,7-dimethyl-8-ribityllumazine synthase [Bacteroidota bacterium]|nr:6,7-dimethyl-8-ribityllumazine synthase [Bacteroidota bacterium]